MNIYKWFSTTSFIDIGNAKHDKDAVRDCYDPIRHWLQLPALRKFDGPVFHSRD